MMFFETSEMSRRAGHLKKVVCFNVPGVCGRASILERTKMKTDLSPIMSNKTALVTGGTSGIGLSLLPVLIEAGFTVHFIGRDADKGQQIESELKAAHNGTDVARFVQLDLSDLGKVKAFAESFRDEVPVLDLLANVAGLMLPERQVTDEGFEKTFAVGYLSACILCRELTPSLAKAANPRIVNVAGVPRFVLTQSLDLDDLGFEKKYSGMDVAIKTVHAKTVLTEILAEQLRDKGITVNSFHPGAVQGDVGRSMSFPMSALFAAANFFMAKTSASGVYVSTSDEVAGITGQFFVGRRGQDLAFDADYKETLWARTVAMIG
jgi:NAD(P)-dependent dehydrogenase (short-subunit alcohol dehydrogenase family)